MAEHKNRRRFGRVVYLGLAALALASSGCLVIAAGATGGAAVGYFYYKGEVFQKYHAGPQDTFAATHAALIDLHMPVVKEEFKDCGGYIDSRSTDGSKVHIALSTQTSKVPAEGTYTLVGVRVGIFGDDQMSEQVLDRINAHLSMPIAMPAPAGPALGPIRPVAATGVPPQSPPPPLATEPPLAH